MNDFFTYPSKVARAPEGLPQIRWKREGEWTMEKLMRVTYWHCRLCRRGAIAQVTLFSAGGRDSSVRFEGLKERRSKEGEVRLERRKGDFWKAPWPQLSARRLHPNQIKSERPSTHRNARSVLGPKLSFVTGLVIFVTAVGTLVCPDLLG